MYWNPDKRCRVCQRILSGDKKLQRRLNECSRYMKGGEAWSTICTENGFSKPSMNTHLTKHQNPDEKAGEFVVSDAIQAEAVKKKVASNDFSQDMLKAAYDSTGQLKEGIVEKLTPTALANFNKQNFEQEKYEEKKDWMKMLFLDLVAQSRNTKLENAETPKQIDSGTAKEIAGEVTEGL